MAGKTQDDGISVMIGTLLLILITVTAAAGLAVMISTMQKDAMNRQAQITAAQNELIQITGVTFQSNITDWNTYFWPPDPNSTLNQSYSSVTFTLTNLNNQEARIIGISVNGKYAHNITVIPDPSLPPKSPVSYNLSDTENSSYITIPASTGKKFRINFTNDFSTPPQNIGQNDQITILVMTTLFNSFQKMFQPPNPIIQYSTPTLGSGSGQRDVLNLDGSQSYAANNNSIAYWYWSIQDASNTLTKSEQQGNCSNSTYFGQLYTAQGKTVQIQPRSRGPFCVNLSVKDSTGMTKVSDDYTLVPENDQFAPPANFWAQFDSVNDTVTAHIKDINGGDVNGAVVTYILDSNPSGNLSLTSYVGETGADGTSSTAVCGNVLGNQIGVVKVEYGNFQPFPVMISNTSTGSC